MYQILATAVDNGGREGNGVVVHDSENRMVVYFHWQELQLMTCFGVAFQQVYRGMPRGDGLCLIEDILGKNSFGEVGTSEVSSIIEDGLLYDSNLDEIIPRVALLNLASPSLLLSHKVLAIVDTDGRLWYLDSYEAQTIRLSDICRVVTKNSIVFEKRDVVFIFDDKLEWVDGDCFVSKYRHTVNAPKVIREDKMKHFMLGRTVNVSSSSGESKKSQGKGWLSGIFRRNS